MKIISPLWLTLTIGAALLAAPAPADAQPSCGLACPADTDTDGLDDREDYCPDSLPGMLVVSDGCSAGELVTRPELLLGPVRAAVARADEALDNPSLWGERDGMAQGLRRAMAAADRLLGKGVTKMSQGRVCAGAKIVGRGVAKMEKVSVRSGALVLAVREDVVESVNEAAEDADTDELRFHEVGYRGGLVGKVLTASRGLGTRASLLCDQVAVAKTVKTGRVVATSDALGLFTLADGTKVLMASKKGRPPVQVGLNVRFLATELADGTLLMLDRGFYTAELADISPGAFTIRCTALRIAPVQPFVPYAVPDGPYVLHDPDGYRLWNGDLVVERSMRLGAASFGCPATGDTPFLGSSYRYSLRVEHETYKGWELLTADLEPGDAPVALPPGATRLRFTDQVQACTGTIFNRTCTRPSPIGDPFEEKLAPRGDRSVAEIFYTGDAFDLATAGPYDFDVAQLNSGSTAGTLLSGTTYAFRALGYPTSGTRIPETIGNGGSSSEFAIYRDDDFGGDDILFREQRFGVNKPSGLAWPRVVGTRDGKPFWYLAGLPDIVRDAVDDCSPDDDSYHRLPWADGTSYGCGQGNNGAFSHSGSQAFAFDFSVPAGTTLRATRGGVVEWLQESQTANYNPSQPTTADNQPFPGGSLMNFGNTVRIRHPDGTWSWYFHIEENGVLVDVGDTVERGQPVATSGNTGRSTSAHLHFQVQDNNTDWGQSIEIRFSTANLGACYIPQGGDSLESDNANPGFP